MAILILTPDINKNGGIANYFRALKGSFNLRVDYFIRGSRGYHDGHYHSLKRTLCDFLQFIRIQKKYDIIHINTSLGIRSTARDALFLIISILFKKKIIVFFRGWNKSFENIIEKYLLWLFKIIYFRADTIITLASEFKDVLIRWGYKENILLETTVVDDWLIDKYDEKSLRGRFIRNNNSFKLLFLARVEVAKGIYEVIESYRKVKVEYPFLNLLIAGDGSELENVKKYVKKENMPNVRFLGYVKGMDKKRTFQNANLYLFPSYHGEGMPNSLLEAMAFGLPCITTNVGGIRDFFEDGKMGYIVNQKDPARLAEFIEILVRNPDLRRSISEYNFQYAKKHFYASTVVKRLEAIYANLLDS